jgi:hypothetical protein
MHDNTNTTNRRAQQQSAAEQINEFGGTDLLDAGLRAIARGWKIFPCNGKKIPMTSHGVYDGTTDEQQIRTWAKQYPGALWGLALPKEIVVIDLDMKHGKNGISEFEKLQGCKPEEFDAPRVRTGTGGVHLYTDATGRNFKNTADKIALGVDSKTVKGYVIIPSGDGFYCWETDPDTPRPQTPEWAEAALDTGEEYGATVRGTFDDEDWPTGVGEEKLYWFCKLVREATEGHWDETRRKVFRFGLAGLVVVRSILIWR